MSSSFSFFFLGTEKYLYIIISVVKVHNYGIIHQKYSFYISKMSMQNEEVIYDAPTLL